MDEHDDGTRPTSASRDDIDTSSAHRLDQLVAEPISSDLADEASGESTGGGKVRDVRGAAATGALDARGSVAGVMGRFTLPDDDVFDQVTNRAQHALT